MPEGGLYNPQYTGLDAKLVWDRLPEEGEDQSGSSGKGNGGFDEHDWEGAKEMSAEDKEELAREIEGALRQGGIYAGKVGGDMLRSVQEMIEPKVDWREVLQRFIRVSLKDRDQPSWRRAHKNYLWQDVILPSKIGRAHV